MKYRLLVFTVLFAVLIATPAIRAAQVELGIDVLLDEKSDLLAGKRVGVITNPTGIDSEGVHIVDRLYADPKVKLVALFGPEHGIRGTAQAGEKVSSGKDPETGLPVYSLYGNTKKPTPAMLKDIDVLIFDIQDIGARFYTYIYTMAYAMEAAAENGVQFMVLDRPNPIGGVRVEGPVLNPAFSSFVGMYPIPIRHGMTVGELARLFNEVFNIGADLTVVPMRGWQRDMYFDETGLIWVKPSPNMRTLSTALVYPGLCFIEGTNVSEGRGTDHPFEMIGAPYVDGKELAVALNELELPGVKFKAVEFTPTSSKYSGRRCEGVFLTVTDREVFSPIRTGLYVIRTLQNLYPDDFKFLKYSWQSHHFFDLLLGTDKVRKQLEKGHDIDEIIASWQSRLNKFRQLRKEYLLY